MASGSFKISTSNQYIEGELQWSSSTNVSGNYSTVNFSLYFYRKNGYRTYGSSGSWTVTIDGQVRSTSHSYDYPSSQAWVLVHSGSVNVGHNGDGTKSINIEVDGNTDTHDVYYHSRSFGLDNIPRASDYYGTAWWTIGIENLSVSIGSASSSFHHSVEVRIQRPSDGAWVWIGDRHWYGTSGSFDFTVAENRLMYQTMQLWENRPSWIRLLTKDANDNLLGYKDYYGTVYGHSAGNVSFNDFNIESNVSGSINNFNGIFSYDVKFVFGSFQKTFVNVGSNPTFNFTSGYESSDAGQMFKQIPNSNSGTGTAYTYTYYDGVLINEELSKGFTAYVVNSNPSFGNTYRYLDSEPTTTNVTGNNQYIIQNKSRLWVEIPSGDKAIARNMASMSYYDITVNGVTKRANYSDSLVSVEFGTINESSNISLSIRAVDSRGNSTTTSKTITVVPYQPPVAIASATRINGFGDQTTLTLNGSVSPLNVNGVNKNSITEMYYVVGQRGGAWGSPVGLANSGFPNYTASSVTINLENLKEYDISFWVKDKLGQTNVLKYVPAGQPIMFMDSKKKSIGINRMPSNNNSLEIGGSGNHVLKIVAHPLGIDMESSGNFAPHYQTDFTIYKGVIGSGVAKMSLDGDGQLTATRFVSTANGEGNNFRIGDDSWFGDVNKSNTAILKGIQNGNVGYLQFGNNGATIGYDGSNIKIGNEIKHLDGSSTNVNVIGWASLNDLSVTGFYRVNGTTTGARNVPPIYSNPDGWFFVKHEQHDGNWAVQTAIEYASGFTWMRSKSYGNWSGWKTVMVDHDSGSNGNGSYIRYSNGTQICWHSQYWSSTAGKWSPAIGYPSGFYYMYMSDTWTFPASFASAPAVQATGDIGGALSESHSAYQPSNVSCSLESGVFAQGGVDVNAPSLRRTMMAFGRWR